MCILRQLSSWTLILLTFERAVSVCFPFKCKELCSRRRIVCAWCVIAAMLFGCNSHFFFVMEAVRYPVPGTDATVVYCVCLPTYQSFLYGPWYWIDAHTPIDRLQRSIAISGEVWNYCMVWIEVVTSDCAHYC